MPEPRKARLPSIDEIIENARDPARFTRCKLCDQTYDSHAAPDVAYHEGHGDHGPMPP